MGALKQRDSDSVVVQWIRFLTQTYLRALDVPLHRQVVVIKFVEEGLVALLERVVRASKRLSGLKLGASRSRIIAPPGHRLLAFAKFFFSRRTVDEVLQPTIEDMREEYHDALIAGEIFKARWIRVRGCWEFFKAAGLAKIFGIAKVVTKLWKA
jgi:hypothetical protein